MMMCSSPRTSSAWNADGSSIELNQKFRRTTSLRCGSLLDHTSDQSIQRYARLRRSIIIGTHETPASDNATLMPGKRNGTRAYSQSISAIMPLTKNNGTATSTGLSGDG